MKTIAASLVVLLAIPCVCVAQVSGNIAYSEAGGKARAEQRERAMRTISKEDHPPTETSSFVEASVLMNVEADEYVAAFGVTTEGETLADCGKKMDATLTDLTAQLKAAGVKDKDLAVDFIAQNRIYGFEVMGDILQEKLVGFELKKTVSIRYKAPEQLEKLALAASKAQVFDLIKVDYIVTDLNIVRDKLMEEAARITKAKMARYEILLGVKLKAPAQIYAEKSAIHYPTQMYDSYMAHESESVQRDYDPNKRYLVKNARKSQTTFYNGLDGSGFDSVLNPVVTEPMVQCTLYLKIKYEVQQPKAE